MNIRAVNSKAICILGMHRSGTSTVSRAVNLLGAYLGEPEELMPATEDNPEGYWERMDVYLLQDRLLAALKRRWDTSVPLPDGWHLAEEVRPFREELTAIVQKLASHPFWAWKDPRTCILFPLWKEVLAELQVEVACLLTVRNPHDVARSLHKRDGIALEKAYGIWFNHTVFALEAIKGTPSAMVCYDRFLEEGERELRRCAARVDLPWPEDEAELRKLLGSFLRKDLRHSRSDASVLERAPRPVRELNALLESAVDRPAPFDAAFFARVDELRKEFCDYAAFFTADVEQYLKGLELQSLLKEKVAAGDLQVASLEKQRADLREKLAEKEQHIAQLEQRRVELDEELARRVHQLSEQTQQVAQRDQLLQQHERQLSLQEERLAQLAQLAQQIAEKDGQLAELARELEDQKAALAELDQRLAEQLLQLDLRDLRLAERDLQVADLDLKLTESDRQLEITQQKVEERDRELGERDRRLAEQEKHLAEQEKHLAEQEKHLAEQEKHLAEQEKHRAEQEKRLAEQEERLAQQEKRLAEQEERLAEQEERLAEQEDRLAEQDERLAEQEDRLSYKRGALASKDSRVAELERQYEAKHGDVLWRDQRIHERDQQLAERERDLNVLHERVHQLAQQLTARDQQLASRDAQLVNLQQNLAEKERRIAELVMSYSWKMSAPLRWAFAIPAFGVSQAKAFYKSYGRFPTPSELPNLIRLATSSFFSSGQSAPLAIEADATEYAGGDEATAGQLAVEHAPAPSPAAELSHPVPEPAFSPAPLLCEAVAAGEPAWSDPLAGYELPEAMDRYEAWVEVNRWNRTREERLRERLGEIENPPLLSVVMPVYNPPVEFLNKAIETVRRQVYGNWELCIADDASTNGEVRTALIKWAAIDARIKVTYREENGNISLATNSAAALAGGSHLVFLDQDDELTPDALGEVALYLAANPEADVIYSDDDKIDTEGRRFAPQFKPDWSPELLLSYMYFSHLFVASRRLFEELGGARVGFEGSQDYDLALRVTEKARHVGHIPLVLYHWRVLPGSTACSGKAKPDSMNAGKRAVQEALTRRGMNAIAYQPDWAQELGAGIFSHSFSLADPPSVTIIISTKDGVAQLQRGVDSILEKTDYANYEILIVDNESAQPETRKYLNDICKRDNVRSVRVCDRDGVGSRSYLNNRAARSTESQYLLFLSEDVLALKSDWLTELVGYAQIEGVGGVGARLVSPEGSVRHGGMFLKFYRGAAGEAFRGISKDDPGYLGYAKAARNYSAVSAACLLTPRSLFLELGGFDDQHFRVSYGDIDYCAKLVEKSYRIVYAPEAELLHYQPSAGASPDPQEKAYFKERYFGAKDRYYNESLSLNSDLFEVWPRAAFTGRLARPTKTLMCTHNLNHEGAPNSQYELTVGLKEKGVINPVVFSPTDGPLRALYESHHIPVIIDPGLGFVFSAALYEERVEKFKNFLAKLGVEMVYANTLINFHVIEAAKEASLPSIWNIRESESWNHYRNWWGDELSERAARCFGYAYKVIFVAHSTKVLYHHFEWRHNFHVISNGLNLNRVYQQSAKYDRESARRELGVAPDELMVFLPGTICERKGQQDLIRAIQLLPPHCLARIKCFMVGDWESELPYNIELHDLAKALPPQVKERLFILPISSEIFRYYCAADIFICTSKIESFPRIILEAMAFGLPIITTPVFGIQEQVQQGVNAVFYQPGDHPGLAHELMGLVLDDERRKRLAANSSFVLRQLDNFDEMVAGYAAQFSEASLSLAQRAALKEGVALFAPTAENSHAVGKVSFLTTYKDENSQRFRVYNLIEALNARGVECAVIKDDFTGELAPLLDSDLLVVFRSAMTRKVQDILAAFVEAAVPTVFDVDDLVFEPESANLLHGLSTLGAEDRVKAIDGFRQLKETLLACDYATGTTSALAKRMELHGKTAFVIPNTINKKQFDLAQQIKRAAQRSNDGKIRIGYFSGTKTHEADFGEVSEALREVMVGHDNVEFHLVGALDLHPEFDQLGARVVRQPLMDYLEMLRYLAGMDINLAPLEMNNAFTACKSELKIFEAALVGVPTVASATDSYAGCITDGVNGLLAATKDQWVAKISRLVSEEGLRKALARQAELDFVKRYYIDNAVEGILSVYAQIKAEYEASVIPPYLIVNEFADEPLLRSLEGQVYARWELVSLDEALERESSEAMVLFPGKGTLPPFALFELTQYLKKKKAQLLYGDEDRISGSTCGEPRYKPDWSPDLFRNCDYVTNFLGVRLGLLKEIGAFASRYDLVLKAAEKTDSIAHVPKILFHVRENVAAIDEEALKRHLERTGRAAVIGKGLVSDSRKLEYHLPEEPKVSIIIPNKDSVDILQTCISSVEKKSSYRNFEIVIAENHSTEEETFAYYRTISSSPAVKIVTWSDPFNFSAVNNFAARQATGEVLLFLNNDVEVISEDWLERMLEYALRKDVGCVGAKLYYPDDTIQHGGVTLGLRGVAEHTHKDFDREADGYFGTLKLVQNVSAVTAACVMLRREVFEAVQGFDEGYPLAFNDIDLCMKIRQQGLLIVWTPFAELYHHESKTRGLDTSPEKAKRFEGEVSYFMSKWSHLLLQGDPYHTFNVASALEDGPRPGGEDPKRDTRSGEVRKKVALLLKRGGADRRQERPFNIFGADRQCPMYAEDFFPCSLLRQEEMLKALTSNPPPIVWLDSSVKLPSLTQYFAYRWLIRQNYRYCTTDGISFMVRSDHFEKAGLPRLSDKEELERLSGLFRIEELRSFPVIWGRLGSFEKTFRKACCEVEMVHANSIEFKDGWGTISTPDDPYLVWKMPAPLDGRKYDFVKIDLECKPARDTQFRGQFFWAGQGDNLHDERAFTFSAQATNPLLIPAGAHPGWLKTPQVDTIRIDIDNYIGDFKINEVSFWSLGD